LKEQNIQPDRKETGKQLNVPKGEAKRRKYALQEEIKMTP
jgi:hypothetical protein